jgi:flavin reductase (DIM6/NTAB) family NADH-FMN oxidoreductase RutF
MSDILIDELITHPISIWEKQWLLLTCGDFEKKDYNAMTVAWGSLGNIWNMPFAQVVVRHSRYTYQFMEKYNSFTLCTFPEKYRQVLNLLGTKSGRDGDKIAESGLTPIASKTIAAPGFAEAELIIECKKIYWDDMQPAHFLDEEILRHYQKRDYHRIYFGKILSIVGKKTK